MSKLETVLNYQQTENKKLEIETALRGTDAYRELSKLRNALKTSQAAIQKMGEDLEKSTQLAAKLSEKLDSLMERKELEDEDWSIIREDEETTSEEISELFGDMDKISKEMNAFAREVKRLFAEIDKAAADYQKTGTEYKRDKARYDELKIVVENERAEANKKLDEIDAELAVIEKEADPELLAKYKKAHVHFADALVPIEGEKCGGCKMSIPMATLKKLEAADATLECENCGRVMYKPAGA